jgi:hypothetical protein
MKAINYLAAIGTILAFAGVYCIKAASQKRIDKEGITTTKHQGRHQKFSLILVGIIFIATGLALIIKSARLL